MVSWTLFSGAIGTVNTVTGSSISGAVLVDGIDGTGTSERIELWVATFTGSAGAVTAALTGAGSNISAGVISVVEMDGDDTTDPIVQTDTIAGRLASTWNEMPFALAALEDSGHTVISFATCSDTGTAWTLPSGFTNLVSSITTYARAIDHITPGDTSFVYDKADFQFVQGIAVEIREAGASNYSLTVDSGSAVGAGQSIALPMTVPITHGQAVGEGQNSSLLFDEAYVLPVTAGSAVGEGQGIPFILTVPDAYGQAVGEGQEIGLLAQDILVVDSGSAVGEGQEITLIYSQNYVLQVDHGQAVFNPGFITLTAAGVETGLPGFARGVMSVGRLLGS